MTDAATSLTFIAAMGQHVSSICVITTAHEGQRFGLTATAMSSVSANPPRLLVCVNKSGISHEKILASGVFCVSVLSEAQDAVAKSFAGMLGKDRDRFASGEWQVLKTGAPALRSAAANFDCRLAETVDQNTHSIFIGDVVAAASRQGIDTLLYGAKRFRTLRKVMAASVSDGGDMLHF
jgi:flavin reductase (DIM6/NTAB) family NADH-FMN oxidoreductase RutF